MSEYLTFAGQDLRQFGVVAFENNTYTGARRLYSTLEVPGKNGNLVIDGQRHPNTPHAYDCVIYQNFEQNCDNLRNFLLSRIGYQRLEDSIHPDEYYMAIYQEDFIIKVDTFRDMGKLTVQFERKPQRFLKSGETAVSLTSSGSITNPTQFDAKPILRVYGTGTLGIGDNAITITAADGYTDIDCEMMECYKGTDSRNGSVEIQNNDFPVLKPGANGITLSGVTRVDITPRWYKL